MNAEDEFSLPDGSQPIVLNSDLDPVWVASGGVALVIGRDGGVATGYTTSYGASGW